ncbi:hypothetical protein HZA57_00725, partial [Candidatus Poribacteria bacterium]|nr:hypothetical protein [Candidatus Poribacteria bacterium]
MYLLGLSILLALPGYYLDWRLRKVTRRMETCIKLAEANTATLCEVLSNGWVWSTRKRFLALGLERDYMGLSKSQLRYLIAEYLSGISSTAVFLLWLK